MNTKPDLIGIMPQANSRLRLHCLDESHRRMLNVRSVGTRHSADPYRLTLLSAEDRVGEFWETLSYAVIWLCGYIGIGLCLL